MFCNLKVYLFVVFYVTLLRNGFISLCVFHYEPVPEHSAGCFTRGLSACSTTSAQFECALAVVDPGFPPKGLKTSSS